VTMWSWKLWYADDLVVIAETEDGLITRLNEWKDNVENRGMRVHVNKTKVMISGEWQKVMQKYSQLFTHEAVGTVAYQ